MCSLLQLIRPLITRPLFKPIQPCALTWTRSVSGSPQLDRHRDERPPNPAQTRRRQSKPIKAKPESQSFYTARASYYDQLFQLEEAVGVIRSSLTTLHLLPLPAFAKASLPQIPTVWKKKDEMASIFTIPLTTARYKKVTALLAQLNEYRRIATAAGLEELRVGVENLVELFERDNKDALLARGATKPVKFDEYGRSYTVGRRKTSAARVWMIRTNTYANTDRSEKRLKEEHLASTPAGNPHTAYPDYIAEVIDILEEGPAAQASTADPTSSSASQPLSTQSGQPPESLEPTPSKPQIPITPSQVLINNTPLATYFPLPADRERIVRPLRIAGLLGAYNVFAIVRGGGMSGQSGAVALGIAKGLVAQEHRWGQDKEGEVVETVLRKAKLLRRDPRMVERKKTGFAKARKRVSSLLLAFRLAMRSRSLTYFLRSMLGSSDNRYHCIHRGVVYDLARLPRACLSSTSVCLSWIREPADLSTGFDRLFLTTLIPSAR